MFNLAFRIWLTAQLVFLAGVGIYSACTGGIGTEAIAAGIFLFLIGMACSLPALFILAWLLKPTLRLANNSLQAMLLAALVAALSALLTYTGWWLALSSPDFSTDSFKDGLDFLAGVIACSAAATLIQFQQFQRFSSAAKMTGRATYDHL